MARRDEASGAALDRAHALALEWLESLDRRPVPPQATIAEVTSALGTTLPSQGLPAEDVVDLLAAACDPGLTAMPSGRFFGFVIGGTPTRPRWQSTGWSAPGTRTPGSGG